MTARGGFDRNWFQYLYTAEDRHFWFRARNRILAAVVDGITAQRPTRCRVLEVGCGNGNVLRALEGSCKNCVISGLDLHREGLRNARRRTTSQLVLGDARHLPFKSAFNVIGAFDLLEHMDDDVGLLRALRSALTPEGVLVLSVPAHDSLWSYFDVACGHFRRYHLAGLRAKLVAAGYRPDYLTYYMTAIFPLVWLHRRVMPRGARSHRETSDLRAAREQALREMRTVPLLNAALEAILAQERHLIARHIKLPVGVSLLACAQKGNS